MPGDKGIHWTHPSGGLYIWVTLPKSIDTSREGALFQSCLASGVIYVPGDYCFQPDESGKIPRHHMRLSFGQVAPDQIELGIAKLSNAISSQLATSNLKLAATLHQ
jgi:2-aminoadipate transaminase